MVKFNDDDKKVNEFSGGKYFDEGVHQVRISTAVLDTTKAGKEYLEFTVIGMTDDDDHEDTVRFWFSSPGAINFSFNRIREIFVHNAPEDKKDATREKFDAIEDTEKLESACAKMLTGKEAWLKVEENKDRPYTAKDGSTKYSFDKNLTGYAPNAKAPETLSDANKPLTVKDSDGNEQQIAEF